MFYKNTYGGYIYSVGVGEGLTQIPEEEYNAILNIINNRPVTPEGYAIRLKTDLTWETYELPEAETEATETDCEAPVEENNTTI